MKRRIFALMICAAIASTPLCAQEEAGQINEIDIAAEQAKMAELQAEYAAKVEELRVQQQEKMAQLRAEENDRIQKEQQRIAQIRMERNQKIIELRNQLMQLESEQANDNAVAGVQPMTMHSGVQSMPMAPQILEQPTIVHHPGVPAPTNVLEFSASPANVISSPAMHFAPVVPMATGPMPSAVHMTPVLMQIYGPPVISPSRGCRSGKCRR